MTGESGPLNTVTYCRYFVLVLYPQPLFRQMMRGSGGSLVKAHVHIHAHAAILADFLIPLFVHKS